MEKPSTILLAEDNANDVALLQSALQKAGLTYRLQVVNDGEQAILYLKGEGPYADRDKFPVPDLVFLDVQMPLKNGLEVLSWVRRQPSFQKLAVIVLTQSSLDSIIKTAYALGASSFLTKPPNSADFVAEVKQLTDVWLSGSPASGTGAQAQAA